MSNKTDYFDETKNLRTYVSSDSFLALGNTKLINFSNLGLNIISEKYILILIILFTLSYLCIICFIPIYYSYLWQENDNIPWDEEKNKQTVGGITYTFKSQKEIDDVKKVWAGCGWYLLACGFISLIYVVYGVRFLTVNRFKNSGVDINMNIRDSSELQIFIILCMGLMTAGIVFLVFSSMFNGYVEGNYGKIIEFSMLVNGTGYTLNTSDMLSGGSGSGAYYFTLTSAVNSSNLPLIVNPGLGYDVGDELALVGGTAWIEVTKVA